ncbi:MAG: rRNA pseudouridine synthase [Balneolaceae bacterium]|nr:rRNA pseudouridine synthase [Balneolaceae bacterium]
MRKKRNSRPDQSRGGKKKRPVLNREKNRAKEFSNRSSTASQKQVIEDEIRINKFIAHAGYCSRREADELIEAGKVKVNGKVVTELGMKIKPADNVVVENQRLSLEPFVYILLNKGRDTISTTNDEKDRNTVLDVVEDATGHRVYPVGRLDRNTTGLIILTNDGDLAHRLMHPSYQVKKTYEITANRPLTPEEVERLRTDVVLDDGPIKPARVKHDMYDPSIVTISVYEGRNHLIRRMIDFIGADVEKLKRTRYAGLSDENLRMGRWRYLRQKEINDLRQLVKLETLDFNREEK